MKSIRYADGSQFTVITLSKRIMEKTTDNHWMSVAIDLATQAHSKVSPNPYVGCVIVGDQGCLSVGYHKGPGQWHAEREAILNARLRDISLLGSTLYVNLEPCCHFGRTPPCTDIIIESGVRRVVVAMLDPDARMRGKGIETLKRAGIEVTVGVGETEALKINAPYLTARGLSRPRYTLKTAMSLCGRIADSSGNSQWITGPETRRASHQLRGSHDGILVGIGTVLSDDPSLTNRGQSSEGNELSQPVPIVLDSQARTPSDAMVFNHPKSPLIYTASKASPEGFLMMSVVDNKIDLKEMGADLVNRGIYNVLIEGGAEIYRSFLEANLIDAIELFVAPKLIGSGKSWLDGIPFNLVNCPTFELTGQSRVGQDTWLSYVRSGELHCLAELSRQ